MTELTTGVVFLMSSLYGAGQHGYTEAAAANAIDTTPTAIEQTIPSEIGTFTNEKVTEAFLRKEFADTPILVEVARCESEFHQFDKDGKLVHGRVNKSDIGIMQINQYYHSETADSMKVDLKTVEGNVAYAKYLYSKFGTSPWNASKPCWGNADLARKELCSLF
ncbi:MAG: hypothetical protein V4481_04590 [Patescibacteria group bacterium]